MKLYNMGIAVKEIPQEEKRVGNIIVPETVGTQMKYRRGKVIAVGSGNYTKPMEVAEDDIILYKRASYAQSEGCDVIAMNDVLFIEQHGN